MESDALVRDYLRRLEAAAWILPSDRRTELVGEMREHIETALADAGRSDEVTVRNLLDRLGRPEEIVAAEVEADRNTPTTAAIPASRPSIGAVEVIALLVLTAGSILLPVVGQLVGLVLVWISAVWSTREKTSATVVVAILLLPPVLLLRTGVLVMSVALASLLIPLAGLSAAAFLLFVLRRRRQSTP
jgi:uncharacterized membrane protein